jgi:hypothetical protein
VQRKGFCKISYIEGVLFILERVFYLEVEPLLVTLGVSVYIQVEIIFSRCNVFGSFKVTAFEK